MKIKTGLLEDPRMVAEATGFLLGNIPSSMAEEELKRMMRSYIELDTGGEFDELSEQAKACIQKGMAIYLAGFGRLLLSALCLDFSGKSRYPEGANPMLGVKTIASGLEMMQERLGFAFDEVEIGSSSRSASSA